MAFIMPFFGPLLKPIAVFFGVPLVLPAGHGAMGDATGYSLASSGGNLHFQGGFTGAKNFADDGTSTSNDGMLRNISS
jgi:hypothetical protein